ncbi:MAG: helix-turn-helix domain-containing protein [bacterium]
MRKINPKGLCGHRSYTIEELSSLLKKTEKTLSRWIEKGLKTIPDSKRPILIIGSDLKEFLRNMYSKKKKGKLNRNQFYCLKCKKAVYAKKGSIKKLSNRKIALCRVCKGEISRIIKPYQKDYKILTPTV